MQKSIMATGCMPRTMSLPEQFELAAEAGFDGIEIALNQEGFFSFDGPAADTAAVAAVAGSPATRATFRARSQTSLMFRTKSPGVVSSVPSTRASGAPAVQA